MTGGTVINGIYFITINGHLPSGETASFEFIINVTPCPSTPIIPPALIPTQVYYVNYPMGDYDAPAFSIDPTCP